MKARFTEKQPAVTWQLLSDAQVDVLICLNEQEVKVPFDQREDSFEQTMFEYDCNQFRENTANITEATVKANQERYLDYVPAAEKTLEQTVAEQDEKITMLTECLMEMSEIVYE